MYGIPNSLSSCTCLFYSTMQLPCRHLLYILVQQNKDIFNKEIIRERWTKEFITFSGQAEEHENVEDLPDSISSGCNKVLRGQSLQKAETFNTSKVFKN